VVEARAMSITLDVPEALVGELTVEARRAGLPLNDYVATLLVAARTASSLPRTGADLVEYWREQGVIGSRPDISDSHNHAEEIRRRAEQRI
jgi:hypothetical protein